MNCRTPSVGAVEVAQKKSGIHANSNVYAGSSWFVGIDDHNFPVKIVKIVMIWDISNF